MNTSIVNKNFAALFTRAERRRQKHSKPVPANIGIEQRDGIPVEVAESMLFTPGVKLTPAMRRNCLAARETVFVSTTVPKDYKLKLAARAKKASALQLVKWAKRTVIERAKITRDYLKLKVQRAKIDPMKLHEIAKCERIMAIMDVNAQLCDERMASYRAEAEERLVQHNVFEPVI